MNGPSFTVEIPSLTKGYSGFYQASETPGVQDNVESIKVRAERRIGQMLEAIKEAGERAIPNTGTQPGGSRAFDTDGGDYLDDGPQPTFYVVGVPKPKKPKRVT